MRPDQNPRIQTIPSARVAAVERQCAQVDAPIPLNSTTTLDSSALATGPSKPAPSKRIQIRFSIRYFPIGLARVNSRRQVPPRDTIFVPSGVTIPHYSQLRHR